MKVKHKFSGEEFEVTYVEGETESVMELDSPSGDKVTMSVAPGTAVLTATTTQTKQICSRSVFERDYEEMSNG